jgi:hypothetical protein
MVEAMQDAGSPNRLRRSVGHASCGHWRRKSMLIATYPDRGRRRSRAELADLVGRGAALRTTNPWVAVDSSLSAGF